MKKIKINFQEDFKLWKACAKNDSVRPVLEYVFFKDGYAFASDANILVRVPLDLCTTFSEEQRDLLDGYAIHADLLKSVVKYDNVSVAHEVVVRDGVEKALAVLILNKEDNFVKVYLSDQLAVTPPKFEQLLEMPKEITSVTKIGIKPEFLSSLSAALGSKRLKTLFTSNKSQIFVTPADEENTSVGIMMPYMLFEEE